MVENVEIAATVVDHDEGGVNHGKLLNLAFAKVTIEIKTTFSSKPNLSPKHKIDQSIHGLNKLTQL